MVVGGGCGVWGWLCVAGLGVWVWVWGVVCPLVVGLFCGVWALEVCALVVGWGWEVRNKPPPQSVSRHKPARVRGM